MPSEDPLLANLWNDPVNPFGQLASVGLARISHQIPSTTAVSAAVDCVRARDSILNVLAARLRSNPSALLATATLTTPRYEIW